MRSKDKFYGEYFHNRVKELGGSSWASAKTPIWDPKLVTWRAAREGEEGGGLYSRGEGARWQSDGEGCLARSLNHPPKFERVA